jgi:CSLREA domain-containing protein
MNLRLPRALPRLFLFALACAASTCTSLCGTARAATFTVSNLSDSGAGSLRQALSDASTAGPHDIVFSDGLSGTIQLSSALPVISRSLTISGPGANRLTVRRNAGTFRIFRVEVGATVTISRLTIANGQAPAGENGGGLLNLGTTTVEDCAFVGNLASSGSGGGIYNGEANITVTRCLFQNNTAISGGGMNAYNSVGNSSTVRASTFHGNVVSVGGFGGGYRNANGESKLESCTIVGNSAQAGNGSGLASSGSASATTTVRNCLIVGNANSDDVSAATPNPFTSLGHNIVGTGTSANATAFGGTADQRGVSLAQARLSPLRDNGGPTLSIIPRADSPAIDKGLDTLATDQRGAARPVDLAGYTNASGGNGGDVGAVELNEAPQANAELEVNQSTDDNDGVCGANHCTLREAIATANEDVDDNSITFSAFFASERRSINLSRGELTIRNRLSITAPGVGVQVSAGQASRVFNITGEAVSMSRLWISNGAVTNDAGGAISISGTLTLNFCTISNSRAAFGGALFTTGTGARATLNTCTLSGNSATTLGGAIAISGGTTVSLNACTVVGNGAVGAAGGGVHNYGGTFESRGSLIAFNVALIGFDVEGAVISSGFNLISRSDNSTGFNQASDLSGTNAAPLNPGLQVGGDGKPLLRDNGGATPTIALLAGSPALDKSNATGADQRGISRPVDLPGSPNTTGGNGSDIGAFESQDPLQPGPDFVVNSTADTGDGACGTSNCTLREAITASNLSDDTNAITFDASVFGLAQQTIALNGTALTIDSNLSITAPNVGVCISGGGASGVFSMSTLNSNRNITVSMERLWIRNGNAGAGEGGGIFNFGQSLTLTSCVLSANSATRGGGVWSGAPEASLTLIACTVSDNIAADQGGGIANRGGSTLSLQNCTIAGNTVTSPTGMGGGVFSSGTASAKSTLIALNSAADGPDAMLHFSSGGFNLVGKNNESSGFTQPTDKVGTEASPLDPRLNVLALNGASLPTRALRIDSPALESGSSALAVDARGLPRIDIATVPNAPGSDGSDIGAFELQIAESNLQVGPAFRVTTLADTNDGACTTGDCSLREAIVASNTRGGTNTIDFAPGLSGTIQLESALPTLESNLSITGPGANVLAVRRNVAAPFRIFTILTSQTIDISRLTISNGFALTDNGPGNGEGGGIYIQGATLSVRECAITGNSAFIGGGGIFNRVGTLVVENCTISGNSGNALGGGGIRSGTSGDFTTSGTIIRNCTISGNSTNGQGGGVYITAGLITIENSTITANTAPSTEGGGIGGANSSIARTRLKNTIVAGNGDRDVQFQGNQSNFISDGFNILGSGEGFSLGAQSSDQTGVTAAQLNLAPLALNSGTMPTHAPLPGSPAIDRGNAAGTDQRGVARPFDVAGIANAGNGSDIGAFELRVPLVDLDASTSGVDFSAVFTEGGPASIVKNNATVSSGEIAQITGATITLTNRPDGSAEVLAAGAGNGITVGPYNANTGVLALSGAATPAAYAQVLSTLTYNNTSSNPNSAQRIVTVTVSDGTYSSPVATSTIAIGRVNNAPIAAPDSATTDEDTSILVPVLANDADADSAALSVSAVTPGANTNGTLAIEGSSVRFTPNANFNGTSTWSYTVSDGALSSSAEVTVTVRPVNDAPVAASQSLQVLEDTPLNITLKASDVDGTVPSLVLVALPTRGALSGTVPNLTYTPGANFNGTDSFTFKATDGAAESNIATVTLQVVEAGDAPIANADSYAVAGIAPLTVAAPGVLFNDADVDGSALSAVVVTQPTSGTLDLNANGSFVYTPTPGFNGIDSFTYGASDGTAQSAPATVTIVVSGNSARSMSLSLSAPSVREGAALIGTLTLSRPSPTNFAILLSSGNSETARVPDSVQVLAGQSRATFTITAPRNLFATGPLSTAITASDRDFGVATATLSVTDIEVAALTLFVAPTIVGENFGPAAAIGTITRNTPLDRALTVRLLSTDTRALRVPASVVIPVGARNATFFVAAVDNRIVNAPQTARLDVSATGLRGASATVRVADNGRVLRDLRLAVESNGRFTERLGNQTANGTLTLLGAPLSKPLAITLVSSDPRRISVPSVVTLPAGKTSVVFSLRVLDNAVLEPSARVFLTARAAGFGSAFVEAIIADNDGPSLSLTLARTSAPENSGSFTATVTRRNVPITATTAALAVSLRSSNGVLVVLPANVSIPRGRASATFSVRLVNNTVVDGTRRVSLSAAASGLTAADATLDVLDDDVSLRPASASGTEEPVSRVALSTASAQAPGQVLVRFVGALDSDAASDTTRYEVTVNGAVVEVESAAYSAIGRVELELADGAIAAGDAVEVRWNLSDAQGRALRGGTTLTAR